MRAGRSRKPVLPGFGLALGFTVTYLGLVVLIPLSTIFVKSAGLGWSGLLAAATTPRVLASYRLSLVASLAAALISAVFGLVVAWVLARYRFPGRRFVDAFVDLPFALPTAVAGLTLSTLYAPSGWIGSLLAPLGIKVAFTPLGIVLALTFIGLPFVVRTLQPVLEDLEIEVEEAAASLGRADGTRFGACCSRPSARRSSRASPSPLRAHWASTARSCSSRATCRCGPRSRRSSS